MTTSTALAISPTYNEAENIGTLIDGVMAHPENVHVLVVDDSSSDGTADIVRGRQEQHPGRVHLLERPGKLGLGTAYLDGFRWALERDYRYALTMDADLSHNPARIPEILHVARIADVVIGSRYVAGGGIRNWGVHRHILSGVANLLARGFSGLRARDCTSGYRCYRTKLLRRLDLGDVRSDGYSCLMELLAMCQRERARIREVPIVFVDRQAGKSKISHREILKAFRTLVLVRRRLRAAS